MAPFRYHAGASCKPVWYNLKETDKAKLYSSKGEVSAGVCRGPGGPQGGTRGGETKEHLVEGARINQLQSGGEEYS